MGIGRLIRSDWHFGRWLVLAVLLSGSQFASLARAEDAPAAATQPDPAVVAEVEQHIEELDDADFATRRAAAARLEEMAGKAEWQAYLASRFRGALLSDETSFEVRSHLEPLLRALPSPPPASSPRPRADQIGPLLDQLDSDSYARRDSAVRRLRAMLQDKKLIVPVWLALKARAADPVLSASERRLLEPLMERAHEAWLLADPADVPLPRPSTEEIAGWIDQMFAVDESQTIDLFERTPAERELLDLIARDETRQQVLDMLAAKIEAHPQTAAAQKMQYLAEFAKPGMAAEAWSDHHNRAVQYLTLGVPQLNDTVVPPRATHFDRIDEQTAHCVTGNSLTEGDYPVRVGIPHPEPGATRCST